MIITDIDHARTLIGRTIIFNKNVEASECDFDVGMKAIITAVIQQEDHMMMNLDFSKFMKYNKTLMQSTYYDSKGMPSERWDEQPSFPTDGKVHEYFEFNSEEWCPFDLEEQSELFRYSDHEILEEVGRRGLKVACGSSCRCGSEQY